MEYLIELLDSLNKGELNILQQNLNTNPHLKRSKLIQSILGRDKRCKLSYDEIGLTESGNYQLAYNAKEWLFSLILQQDVGSKKKSEIGRNRYQVYKYLLFSTICVSYGIRRDSVEYLVKAQKICQKYEFVSLEIEVVNELIAEFITSNEFEKLQVLKERQLQLEGALHAMNQVVWIRQELHKNNITTSNWDYANRKIYETKLNELEQLADKSGLIRIKEAFLRVRYVFCNSTNDFKKALKTAESYLKLVERSPMIRSNNNKAGGNMITATTLNRLGKFQMALRYGETARKLFGEKNLNSEIASQVLFTSTFHLKRYDEAMTLVKRCLKNKLLKKSPMRRDKWHFFEAAVQFVLGEYDLSMRALRNSREILKDKSGWQYGYRILEILIQYENDGAEILDNYILNFRRFIRGHTVQSKTRISLILKVLSALEKSQFNFKRIAKSHVRMLRTLEDGKGLYFYEPAGFELIRFDQWFRKHLKETK